MWRYPDRKSASIPALWAVQRRYGWCTPEGIRQAAAVMRVTPAYLESVASFYDLLHTEPVGTHRIAVCTNISCWMRGGDELLDAFRPPPRATRTSSSPASSAWAPATSRRWPRSTSATSARSRRPRRGPRSSSWQAGDEVLPEKALAKRPLAGDASGMPDPRETRVLLEHAEDPALRTIAGYKGYGGYATLEKAYREMEADEVLKELEDSGLRGRGGAGFSMGKKASFLPRGEMATSTSAATRTSPSPAPSRTAS